MASINVGTGTEAVATVDQARFDWATRLLHFLLALGIVGQLALSAVMHVPPGPGQGVFDWHREAFEIHARTGLVIALLCGAHWLWILMPFSRPGALYLFPWASASGRNMLLQDSAALWRPKREQGQRLNYVVGATQGVAFLAVTGSVVGGLVNYAGYFVGLPVPRLVLHDVGRVHLALGYFLWAFVIVHVTATLIHWFAGDRQILAIFRLAPRSRTVAKDGEAA